MNVFSKLANSRLGALKQQYGQNNPAKQQEFEDKFLTPHAREFLHQQLPGAKERQQPIVRPEGGGAPDAGGYKPSAVSPDGSKIFWDGKNWIDAQGKVDQ